MFATVALAIYVAVLIAECVPDEPTAAPIPLRIVQRTVPGPQIIASEIPLRLIDPGHGPRHRHVDEPEAWITTSNPQPPQSWVSVPMPFHAPTSTNTAHGSVSVSDGIVVIANTGAPYIGGY